MSEHLFDYAELDAELTKLDPPANPMFFRASQTALSWLKDKHGLEIGGSAHNDFHVSRDNVAPPDWADFKMYAHEQFKLCGQYLKADIVAEADDLNTVASSSYDFVLNSHVFEHLANPIKALLEWHRVAVPHGLIYMHIPHRDALEADRHLPITPVEHFWDDYVNHASIDTHPLDDVPGGRRGHYHRFTLATALDLIAMTNERLGRPFDTVYTAERDDKVGNSLVVVLSVRKDN